MCGRPHLDLERGPAGAEKFPVADREALDLHLYPVAAVRRANLVIAPALVSGGQHRYPDLRSRPGSHPDMPVIHFDPNFRRGADGKGLRPIIGRAQPGGR